MDIAYITERVLDCYRNNREIFEYAAGIASVGIPVYLAAKHYLSEAGNTDKDLPDKLF